MKEGKNMLWTLKGMRANVGMTQKQMAKLLDVSENTVVNLERDGKLQVQVSHPDKPVSACCN